MYESPEHLVLHHNHVTEGLTGALVGVITLKDPQLSPLSIKLLYDPGSAFEVRTIAALQVHYTCTGCILSKGPKIKMSLRLVLVRDRCNLLTCWWIQMFV